ncbi:putative transcriptional regulatory protein C1683.13c-like protein 1 [Colletotrichum chlorophyti]|uniref:Putative transcriptional regulatory protein C1683.13c-like protein 1 n=1 Tax=Colletotrichum chlorophyti TaxID=708187 RepID=A0A1Q8RUB7_9PEZI|nr:putative transcriptional regulatory protein C1683.13c-like protein 1 [Colletotrichum chlorophyti]
MDTDAGAQAELPGSAGQGSEPLACVTCRSRKLKCDRVKPVCSRCSKVKGECVYPESRRKPAFKRKNVKELEERLAQVEDLLKEAGKANCAGQAAGDLDSRLNVGIGDYNVDFETVLAMQNGTFGETIDIPSGAPGDRAVPPAQTRVPHFDDSSGELIGLGLTEALPPFEMMEELNKCFFERQQHFLPIINPGRYLQSFYSAPHKRPPMCLQYAVWSMASNGHEKYSQHHEIFYKRARQYADADEMKGYGEHFLTIQHAQAWALIATDEARCLYFTRAAMSSAKCVRLVQMMGLHRLDGDSQEMAPTLLPPTSWVDLEERRRAFWGAYCIDCHASIATGWPTLIDPNEITTHLPSSEEAFNSGREEETSPLQEAFKGASYSTFAGAVVICYVFNMLLKHSHWERPNDRPADVEYGEFWKRHRDIDNLLSSAFMFLPERFRLPQSIRDPTAIHTNLNLHASVICLHHAAIDRIERFKLPDQLKAASALRLRTAAEEVVNIVKLTSHINSGYKSPMVALSLYSAASVYVYTAKCDPQAGMSPSELQNLKFIINAMEAIGRKHTITKSFLQQIFMDIERNGLSGVIDIPNLTGYKNLFGWTSSNIPLLARSSISRHTEIQSPLPGRLPLGNPKGTAYDNHPRLDTGCFTGPNSGSQPRLMKFDSLKGDATSAGGPPPDNASNKRKRMSQTTSPEPPLPQQADAFHGGGFHGGGFHIDMNMQAAPLPPPQVNGLGAVGGYATGLLRATGMMPPENIREALPTVNLPDRTGPSTAPSPSSVFNNRSTPSQSTGGSNSSGNTPPGLGNGSSTSPEDGSTTLSNVGSGSADSGLDEVIDISSIQNSMLGGTWDSRGLQYAPSADPTSFLNLDPSGGAIDPWSMFANMDELGWDDAGGGLAAVGGFNGTEGS